MSDAGCTVSTHVLDLEAGAPAAGMSVLLADAAGTFSAQAVTDADGRIAAWPQLTTLAPGTLTLTFATGAWYAARGARCFYPEVQVRFAMDVVRHYHVPLLLNRHGYSTYRGS